MDDDLECGEDGEEALLLSGHRLEYSLMRLSSNGDRPEGLKLRE